MSDQEDLDYYIMFPTFPPSPKDATFTASGKDQREEFVFVYEEDKRPVVILLGWAGCQDRYLAKYSAIYEDKRYFAVLLVVSEIGLARVRTRHACARSVARKFAITQTDPRSQILCAFDDHSTTDSTNFTKRDLRESIRIRRKEITHADSNLALGQIASMSRLGVERPFVHPEDRKSRNVVQCSIR